MEHGFQFYIKYPYDFYVPNESTNFYDTVDDACGAAKEYLEWMGGKASMKNIGIDEISIDDGYVEVIREVIVPAEALYIEDEW